MSNNRLPQAYAEDARAFGEQVRRRREALGWSQDELIARSQHAIAKTLQNVEQGLASRDTGSAANPQLSTPIALCTVLDSRVVIDMNRPSGFVIEFVDQVPGHARRVDS